MEQRTPLRHQPRLSPRRRPLEKKDLNVLNVKRYRKNLIPVPIAESYLKNITPASTSPQGLAPPQPKVEPVSLNPLILLGKIWRGEFPLVIMFWGFLIGVNFVTNLFFQMISTSDDTMVFSSFAVMVILLIPYVSYEFIACVGTWRAATAYEGNNLWSALAKIVVVLSMIGTLLYIVLFFIMFLFVGAVF